MKKNTIAADSKGRVTLGPTFAGKQFSVRSRKDGSLILEPAVTIVVPESEAWLFANATALESLKRGIDQARSGEIEDLGTFAEFANED